MANGSQVSTGCKLELSIGGVVVAYASDVSYNIQHNHQPIELLGETTVNEHAELGITCDFTATMFRVAKKAAIALGIMPKISTFLTQPELVCTIYDKTKSEVLVTLVGVKCTGRNSSVNARGAMTEQLSFVAKVMFDEEGQ